MTILIIRRPGGYEARFKDEPAMWVNGKSPEETLGKLIKLRIKRLPDLKIIWPAPREEC